MITVDDVSLRYGGHLALEGVGIVARNSEVLGLIGPNGSGKSSLLRVVQAAITPHAGTVDLDGTAVGRLRGRALASRIASVAQESPADLPFTVTDMVLLGRAPWARNFAGYTRADRTLSADALRRVGARDLADRNYSSLSGGERQRVLIARALAQQADHLLLDEPTNHLDVRHQHELLSLIRELDVTAVIVLHDLNLAARYCDRLALLDNGRIAAAGTVDEVLTPEILQPVYEVSVERVDSLGSIQLIFGPRSQMERTNAR